MSLHKNQRNKTACFVCIGNEILTGEVIDQNLSTLAKKLIDKGIDLVRSVFIKDEEEGIIEAIFYATKAYDYVFTSGGIGSTHDDITTESISKCFNVKMFLRKDFEAQMENALGRKLNKLEQKMVMLPENAKPIINSLTIAPGYLIENVFVMAGVPSIFEAMSIEALKMLPDGKKIYKKIVRLLVNESSIAEELLEITEKNKNVEIGSYPIFDNKEDILLKTKLVIRGYEIRHVESAYESLILAFGKYLNE